MGRYIAMSSCTCVDMFRLFLCTCTIPCNPYLCAPLYFGLLLTSSPPAPFLCLVCLSLFCSFNESLGTFRNVNRTLSLSVSLSPPLSLSLSLPPSPSPSLSIAYGFLLCFFFFLICYTACLKQQILCLEFGNSDLHLYSLSCSPFLTKAVLFVVSFCFI